METIFSYLIFGFLGLVALHIIAIFPIILFTLIYGVNSLYFVGKLPVFRLFEDGGKFVKYREVFYFPVLSLVGGVFMFSFYLFGVFARATNTLATISLVVFVFTFLFYTSYRSRLKENLDY